MKQKIKTFLAVVILILVFSILTVSETQAGTGESGRGWLWEGSEDCDIDRNGFEDVLCGGNNISTPIGTHPTADGVSNGNESTGWISVNNLNCDADKNGFVDVLCGSNNATIASVSYGVNIPASDGALSGYAWSENIGWVGFNPADIAGCPNGSCTAQRTGNNLEGWARITGIANAAAAGNSGGWQGWIKLSGTAQDGSPYGVIINADGTLADYAWSDELGWINFSRAFIDASKTLTGSISANPNTVSDSITPVSITANITGGTAAGNAIKYELDCTNNGTIENTYNSVSGETSHIFSNACTYSATSTVSVKITRDSVPIAPTAQVIFTLPDCLDPYCDTSGYTCETRLSPFPCTGSCNPSTCKKPVPSGNWIEVAPSH